jgi:two-component system sensor histidine kinase UhpB
VIEDPAAREALETLQALTSRAVESARRVSHELHPATLRLLGLAAALQAHCVEVEKRHDVQVGLATTGNLRGVPTDVALCLFRIVQEALRNSAVHGEARRLQVSVVESASSLSLTIADDGRGFDLACVRRTGRGLGLVSMAERARLAGGELAVLTSPGQGTTIRVRIPARALAHVS